MRIAVKGILQWIHLGSKLKLKLLFKPLIFILSALNVNVQQVNNNNIKKSNNYDNSMSLINCVVIWGKLLQKEENTSIWTFGREATKSCNICWDSSFPCSNFENLTFFSLKELEKYWENSFKNPPKWTTLEYKWKKLEKNQIFYFCTQSLHF